MWLNGLFSASETLLLASVGLVIALWLDRWLGEPNRWHPLVGFGNFAMALEKQVRRWSFLSARAQGGLAWSIAVLIPVAVCAALSITLLAMSPLLWMGFHVAMLYLSLGGRSLVEHAHNIYLPLKQGDIEQARYQVSMIVSRNTHKMDEKEITSSAIESVLENGNDAVFAPMFWFLLLGAPGAVLFRLANTLDAMWGYKNEKYLHFGYFAARIDDLLGFIPARITALVYALQGNFPLAISCWKKQANECSSPNGGVVMTTGAGALGVQIGGPTYYHGVLHEKKPMGVGQPAGWETIPQANQLVSRGSTMLACAWLILVIGGIC